MTLPPPSQSGMTFVSFRSSIMLDQLRRDPVKTELAWALSEFFARAEGDTILSQVVRAAEMSASWHGGKPCVVYIEACRRGFLRVKCSARSESEDKFGPWVEFETA